MLLYQRQNRSFRDRLISRIFNFNTKQNGFALPIVLAFLALGAIVIGPFLYHAGVTLVSSRDYNQLIDQEYSADSGVEHAIWSLTNSGLSSGIPAQGNYTAYTLSNQVNGLNPFITVTNGGSSKDNQTNYHIQSVAGSQTILASVDIGNNSAVRVVSWQVANSIGINQIPGITSISPSSKNIGDAEFTLVVSGTGFISGSKVQFNGLNRATTFVSESKLTATIPSTDLTVEGTFPVVVVNPAPGGGISNTQAFTLIDTNPTITVQFKDSTGSPLSGGVVQYYSGYWKVFGTTDASGKASKKLLPGSYSFSINYAFGRQEKSQNVSVNSTVVFQTTRVTIQLKDSTGNAIDTGTVQYYSGGWRDIGNTSSGNISTELLPLSYSFSMNYAFGRQEKSQNVSVNSTVVFQTTRVTIQLKDSTGNAIDTGTVQYYSGGWRDIGNTSSGNISTELLQLSYSFSMNYAFGRQEKSQNVSVNSTVVFQTTRVTIQLKDSTGNAIDTGTVQYYSGGWRDIGNTSSGNISTELLPLSYSFSMNYAFGRQEKSQDVSVNSTVVFQTTRVTIQLKDSTGNAIDTGTVQYYSGGWRDIGNTSSGNISTELLPLSYSFSMNYAFGRQEKSQDVSVNSTVVFQTTRVTIQLKDSTGNAIDTGTVQYYSGGWRDIGNTSSGNISTELLQLSYSFSMNYAFGRQEKSQDVSVNSTVVFQTTRVTIQLKDSTGNAIDTGTVQYYSGGWRDIGNTSSGNISTELLQLSYSFSMNYAFGRQEKSQDVSVNSTVVFQTTRVTIQLKDSTGNAIDTGTVQYYSGGWRDIGNTSGGNINTELLPLSYSFSMNYAFGRQEKSQDVSVNSTVVFQTGKIYSNSGSCILYYAGGWRIFNQNLELLPLTWTFHFNDGKSDQSYTIISGLLNYIY